MSWLAEGSTAGLDPVGGPVESLLPGDLRLAEDGAAFCGVVEECGGGFLTGEVWLFVRAICEELRCVHGEGDAVQEGVGIMLLEAAFLWTVVAVLAHRRTSVQRAGVS